MEYQLTNESLTVTLKSAGAEMISVKNKEGLEYMWCGDSKYWGRHAPVLFPIVGKVLDNKYTHKGAAYTLTQHGFARDCEFDEVVQTQDSITFVLKSSEKTKEKYPFDFTLKLTYTLANDTVRISYEVINEGQEVMPFAIGAHPAFNCPMFEDETLEDYSFEFEVEEKAKKLFTTPEIYLSGETKEYKVKSIPLSWDFFKDDAVILTELESDAVTLKSSKHNHSVTMKRKELPFLGLWSPREGAPFVCIEPWVGHTDYVTNSLELDEKKDFVHLAPSNHFECSYEIIFK